MRTWKIWMSSMTASAALILAAIGTSGLPVWGAYTPDRYVPTGTIIAYAGTSVPAGFLMADGKSQLRLSYPALAAALGCVTGSASCAYGAADTLHFNTPDLRGKFPRGTDNMGTAQGASGNDPNAGTRTACIAGGATGNAVGSCQGGATAVNGLHDTGHTHGYAHDPDGIQFAGGGNGPDVSGGILTNNATTGSGTAVLAGDSETRPLNVYVNYIVKY